MYRGAILGLAACAFRAGTLPPPVEGSDAPPAVDAVIDGAPDAPAQVPGLVAWYEMEDLVNGVARDSSGNGHDGACVSCPTVAAGKIGNAYTFAGGQRIDIAPAGGLASMTALTVAMWLRFDSATGQYECAVNKAYGGTGDNSWQMCVTDQSTLFFHNVGDSVSTVTTVPTATWHHVAITLDGSGKGIWYDGTELASDTSTNLVFDGSPVTLGADIDAPGSGVSIAPLSGALDDVRIYDRALGSGEIRALAQ